MCSDDFYMILPSNVSSQNNASDYKVSWDTTHKLDPNENWKVALTEASYTYDPHTISSNLSIEYEYFTRKVVYTAVYTLQFFNEKVMRIVKPQPELEKWVVNISLKNGMYLDLIAKHPFSVKDSEELGFQNAFAVATEGNYRLIGNKNMENLLQDTQTNEKHLPLTCHFYQLKLTKGEFKFPKDIGFVSAEEFAKYLKQMCNHIFQGIDVGMHFVFKMKMDVYRIKFNSGLNFILGYKETEFCDVSNNWTYSDFYLNNISYHADYPPQMIRGVENMYIYASCCAPVYVGRTIVPLLKNIIVDHSPISRSHGNLHTIVIQNPMYVKVANTAFSDIHISICNDAGKVIDFPKGAITVLTLHFKPC
jgi:hypothetical protein